MEAGRLPPPQPAACDVSWCVCVWRVCVFRAIIQELKELFKILPSVSITEALDRNATGRITGSRRHLFERLLALHPNVSDAVRCDAMTASVQRLTLGLVCVL